MVSSKCDTVISGFCSGLCLVPSQVLAGPRSLWRVLCGSASFPALPRL